MIRASIPCPAWLSWLVERDNPFFRNNRADVIIEHLALQPGMKVLDFGCGPAGYDSACKKGWSRWRGTALDIQPGMLKKSGPGLLRKSFATSDFFRRIRGRGALSATTMIVLYLSPCSEKSLINIPHWRKYLAV